MGHCFFYKTYKFTLLLCGFFYFNKTIKLFYPLTYCGIRTTLDPLIKLTSPLAVGLKKISWKTGMSIFSSAYLRNRESETQCESQRI